MSLTDYLASPDYYMVGKAQMDSVYFNRPPVTSERMRRFGVVFISAVAGIESAVHFGSAVGKITWAVSQLPLYSVFGGQAIRKAVLEARIQLIRSIKLVLVIMGSLTLGIVNPARMPDLYYRLSLVKKPHRVSQLYRAMNRWMIEKHQNAPYRFRATVGCLYVGILVGLGALTPVSSMLFSGHRISTISESVMTMVLVGFATASVAAAWYFSDQIVLPPAPVPVPTIRVTRDALENTPFTVLGQLHQSWQNPMLPFPVIDLTDAGAAAQGQNEDPARFLNRLTKSLIEQSPNPYFVRNENGAMPVRGLGAAHVEFLEDLAGLFLRCIRENWTIGRKFSPKLYRMLLALSSEELMPLSSTATTLSDEVRLRLLDNSEPLYGLGQVPEAVTNDQYQYMLFKLPKEANDLVNRDQNTPENVAWARRRIQKIHLADDSELPTQLASVVMAKEMYNSVGLPTWNQWRFDGADGLRRKIEGQ